MPNWKKLSPKFPITEDGARLQDGRWMCVVRGPSSSQAPKVVFCLLVEGEWFDDSLGNEGHGLGSLVVTHVAFVPELPAVDSPKR